MENCDIEEPTHWWDEPEEEDAGNAIESSATRAEHAKGERMSWLNGRDRAAVSVPPPTAAIEPGGEPLALVVPDNRNGSINPFAKAVKYAAKGRVALIGPAGSGKSYTMLLLARALAGPKGRIAAIDTEHGSLSKYADIFDFDVIELDSFSPETFVNSLHAAESSCYDVFCCDSLSHFWVGRDGALEFVDMAAKRSRDNMGGWKEFRPHERLMVDEMISSTCHVICTMRTKTDYQEQTDSNGKKKRVKIGLAPVQRDGLEYEFDLVGYMDEDNTFITDKTRCSAYAQKAYTKPGPAEFASLVEWLNGAAGAQQAKCHLPQIDIGNNAPNTRAAAQYVAKQKIANNSRHATQLWKNMGEVERAYAAIREEVGEVVFREALGRFGWTAFSDIRKAMNVSDPTLLAIVKTRVSDCYWAIADRANGGK